MIRISFSEVCNRKSTQRSTLLIHYNMYWKYLGKLTKSDYYIIKRKDSILIIRRGGTFLPTPGHVKVKLYKVGNNLSFWNNDLDIFITDANTTIQQLTHHLPRINYSVL